MKKDRIHNYRVQVFGLDGKVIYDKEFASAIDNIQVFVADFNSSTKFFEFSTANEVHMWPIENIQRVSFFEIIDE